MKISIITVSYNSEKFIESCINSLLSQSYKNVEYIIIDGASKDNTLNIIKKYSDQISVIVSEPDQGIYDAMNKGIKIAKGDIIGFLHSDDLYANSEILRKVHDIFNIDETLEACYADLIYVKQFNISKIVRYFKSGKFIKGLFQKGWCPPHPTFFVRRSIYNSYGGFDLNYRFASDIDLMMRFLEIHNIKVTHVPEVWIKMRIGGTSNKNLKNIWLQNQEILKSFNKNGLNTNLIFFFLHKIISRSKQFILRPNK